MNLRKIGMILALIPVLLGIGLVGLRVQSVEAATKPSGQYVQTEAASSTISVQESIGEQALHIDERLVCYYRPYNYSGGGQSFRLVWTIYTHVSGTTYAVVYKEQVYRYTWSWLYSDFGYKWRWVDTGYSSWTYCYY